MKSLLRSLFFSLLCLLTFRITIAGNKERNLWSAILINKIEDVEKYLKKGADPNCKNAVSGEQHVLFIFALPFE